MNDITATCTDSFIIYIDTNNIEERLRVSATSPIDDPTFNDYVFE